jgi:hypothetical protein
MIRAVALSLLVLFSVAVIVPIMDSSAHSRGTASARHHRRHSRAWWRRYHARVRRRRELARKRALEMKLNPGGIELNAGASNAGQIPIAAHFTPMAGSLVSDPRGAWKAVVPTGWGGKYFAGNGEIRFKVLSGDGHLAGFSSVAPVNVATSSNVLLPLKQKQRFLANVAFTDLRAIVINKMMASNGWVVNDVDLQIEGHRVYAVQAQTAASAGTAAQCWTFFFTELDGRVYSVSVAAQPEYFEQVNAGAERFIGSLKSSKPAADTGSGQ